MYEVVLDEERGTPASLNSCTRVSKRQAARLPSQEHLPDISVKPSHISTMSGHHSSQSRGSSSRRHFRRSRSIKSDDPLEIQGPLDIQGSVKSGGSINFNGDFIVKDKIDAYGGITMNGNVSCESVSHLHLQPALMLTSTQGQDQGVREHLGKRLPGGWVSSHSPFHMKSR